MSRNLIAFVSGVTQSVANSAIDNAYDEEYQIEVEEHPDESPPVHAWHAAGRLVGDTLRFFLTGS
ncbi:hypothetical protein [Roseofilum capinflatum]|uniref:Uncharacterized protein n=1 Tax=Roseofilum capinflatum BLCC-M114 TaxID=3022440 RepID=A0ABT7BD77_9CYAN|nr:hypothetical protein [Roseofilum capinflatum]MDJ1177121.1 hypothetical protein [Roseofilum capinflatum BLCC-M114]